MYAIETFEITKKFARIKGYRELFSKRKDIIALDNVNIKVKKGEIFGILGQNGSGKTTLIKILCSLVLPDKGTAYVNGYDVVKNGDKVKETVGLVTGEERSFYWRLTGRQNLEFFASLYNSNAIHRIDDTLKVVGLVNREDDRFDSYSTGMKQKLAIARGLLNDPLILFMDEPTKGLDPSASRNIMKFVKDELVGKYKKTIFLSTNHLEDAEIFCDRIAIIDNANIKACGEFKDLEDCLITNF